MPSCPSLPCPMLLSALLLAVWSHPCSVCPKASLPSRPCQLLPSPDASGKFPRMSDACGRDVHAASVHRVPWATLVGRRLCPGTQEGLRLTAPTSGSQLQDLGEGLAGLLGRPRNPESLLLFSLLDFQFHNTGTSSFAYCGIPNT